MRYKSDKELNNRMTKVITQQTGSAIESNLQSCRWADLKVGDIIRVDINQEIPADILCIHAPKDVVFISTMNLDGETNLKERTIPFATLSKDTLSEFSGTIMCDKPNESLEYWDGNVHSSALDQTLNCSIKNTILRGCTLKNTDYCFGIVLYVGQETKIMMNSKKAPRKVSKVMLTMNYMLYTVFAFQIGLVLVFAGLSYKWTQVNSLTHSYLTANSTVSFGTFIIQFFTYWVAYSHMIPISLYVIIELLKLGLARHINKDIQMYFQEEGGVYSECRNSDLIEEMGQVEFVFSDKTGTLT